ncbi:MAG: transposase, partial [Actinomycetaceae bacterium]|nr:transposase [Actinomycetaceae bacterium]
LVPPQNTSRTCPVCGHVSAENRQTQACFRCVKCGYEANADVVGAINVLKRGRTMSLCGEATEARPKRSWSRSFRRSGNPPKCHRHAET